jgi:hypothetical protein
MSGDLHTFLDNSGASEDNNIYQMAVESMVNLIGLFIWITACAGMTDWRAFPTTDLLIRVMAGKQPAVTL